MSHSPRIPVLAERLARDPRLAGRFVHFYERLRALPRNQRRWLGRRARLSLAAAALLLALSRAPSLSPVRADTAATITVANGEVAIANNNLCSLIEAINNANDTVDGVADESGHDDCAPGNPAGPDVIALPTGGSFAVNEYDNYDLGYSALPLITSIVTVEGNGSTITRTGKNDMRFFTATGYDDPNTTLTLNDLTLTNGRNYYDFGGAVLGHYANVVINNCTITGNEATAGGAIYAAYGKLTITDSNISDNTAQLGGGIYTLNNETSLSGTTLQGNLSDYGAGGGLYAVGGDTTLTQLTVTGNDADTGAGIKITTGTATITDSVISGNISVVDNSDYEEYSQGGGLYLQDVTATITGTDVTGNTAFQGAGLAILGGAVTLNGGEITGNDSDGPGGGLQIIGGDQSITDTLIDGNTAADLGGGIHATQTTLTLSGVTLSGNSAGANGGGLWAGGSTTQVALSGGAITGNIAAGMGGGLFQDSGATVLTTVRVSGNAATSGGGGLFGGGGAVTVDRSLVADNESGDGGGARTGLSGNIALVNSTLSGNSAAVSGGGLFNAGTMTVVNTTLSGNTAGVSGGGAEVYSGTLTLQRALIAGNTAPGGREASRAGGTAVVGSHNLFGFGGNAGLDGFAPGATDLVPATPLAGILGALTNNGGPTSTHALATDSPAIDAAPSAACAAAPVNGVDQRGEPRNRNGDSLASANECDIGAFEAPGTGDPPPLGFKVHVPVILR